MMQPVTLPPWLSPWSSGLLYGQRVYKGALRERYRPRDRHRPRLTIYTYNHDDSQILRISGWGSGSAGAAGDVTNTVRPLGWERYGLDREPWRLAAVPAHPPPHDLYREIHIKAADAEAGGPGQVGAVPPGGGGGGGWAAARGWAAGTALLALLVVLARAVENCIDRKFFKNGAGAGAGASRRRRRSDEWPTPNVLATTSQQQPIVPGLEIDSLPPSITVDLPPPYSECTAPAPAGAAPKPEYPEEPPPPYSDCYVEFSNKNGISSVLIFSRRRDSILNRHEIVAGRDEATTSDQRSDDTRVVALDDIRVEERGIDVVDDVRNEVNINVEHNAQTSSESAPDITNITIVTDDVANIPEVSTIVVNTNHTDKENVKVV